MSYSISSFKRIQWTNEFGQVLTPGDRVVVVSTGYSHNVKTRVGTFAGVRITDSGEVVSAVVDNIVSYGYNYATKKYENYFTRSSFPNKRVYKLA